MSDVVYGFDPTGRAAENKVQNELHTLAAVNAAPSRIIIPTFAPFYANGHLVEHIALNGTVTELHEGVDYYLALPYMDATRSTGKSLYGGIPIINSFADGGIRITYQTVGDKWCCDVDYVYARLAETIFNPRMTWWDKLTNVQDLFPPMDHDHSLDDVYQITVLFDRLTEIRDAILQAPTNVPGSYIAHMLDKSKHPSSLQDLGVPADAIVDPATDYEVVNKLGVDKSITLRQLILFMNNLSN